MKLSIDSVSKTYPNGVKAIDNLSLEINSGMFGLLGPNGAGKSSLMRTLATLQEPDSGKVFFDDIDVLNNPMQLRSVLGYLPQDFGVYQKVSAEKLLEYLAVLKGLASKKNRTAIIDRVLELTNLEEVRKKAVSSFSGGMRQRFGIAQLLLNDPKLIIVDEPTAGLDPAERNRFLNVLRDIGTENIVIFSTHLVEDVRELCSNMAIMNKGSILHTTTPSEAINSLENKIWLIKSSKDQLDNLKKEYQVLSSSFNEDHSLNVRIYSEQNLDSSAISANPNLEDVYFHTLQAKQ